MVTLMLKPYISCRLAMPWRFRVRCKAVKCRGCSEEIEASAVHLSIPGHKNYHTQCVPDALKARAWQKVRRGSLADLEDNPSYSDALNVLYQGAVVHESRREELRALKRTWRTDKLKQLHESYNRDVKPKVTIC